MKTSKTTAIGGLAIAALGVGAMAVGALAIGALAVSRLKVGRARIRRLEIDELVIHRVRRMANGHIDKNAGGSHSGNAEYTDDSNPP